MSEEVDRLASEVKSLNLKEHANANYRKNGAIIVCDAWYGFPTQKRPRRERILAVSKQIYNFMKWRKDYVTEKNLKRAVVSSVLVIGKNEDVDAIRERVEELQGKDSDCCDGDDDDDDICNAPCYYLPGKDLEDLAGELVAVEMQGDQSEVIAYLSPDASEKLSAIEAPPRIVVVGMLVDRKVQPNRSKIRAESLLKQSVDVDVDVESSTAVTVKEVAIVPFQLPLDALNVSDLSQDECLNIDTVMEMIERWWVNAKFRDGDTDAKRKVHFRDAAARALMTHRQRHPNRTIHGGASTTNT